MKKKPSAWKRFSQQFLTLDDTPHRIAAGAATGLFMGILPIESIFSSFFVTSIFHLNHAAALVSVAITNIWAMIATLPLAAAVGGNLFGTSSEELTNQFHLAYQGGIGYFFTEASFYNLTLPLLVGYAVVSALISFAFYCGLYIILKRSRLRL